MEAVALVKRERIDFLLAVGGGSVVDGSKFVAAGPASRADLGDPAAQGPVEAALPLGCVLTLPATGSESNPAAVVSRGEPKLSFMNPLVQPVFAVLDPLPPTACRRAGWATAAWWMPSFTSSSSTSPSRWGQGAGPAGGRAVAGAGGQQPRGCWREPANYQVRAT